MSITSPARASASPADPSAPTPTRKRARAAAPRLAAFAIPTLMAAAAVLVPTGAQAAAPVAPTYTCQTTEGSLGSAPGQFDYPKGIAYDAPRDVLWVLDSNTGRLQSRDMATGAYTEATPPEGGWPTIAQALGVAVDPLTDDVIVADSERDAVIRYVPETGQWSDLTNGYAGFDHVPSVAVAADGTIYAATGYTGDVVSLAPGASSWTVVYDGPGTDVGAEMGTVGVAVSADGSVYVLDRPAAEVHVISTDGTVSDLELPYPIRDASGITVDLVGRVYVVDEKLQQPSDPELTGDSVNVYTPGVGWSSFGPRGTADCTFVGAWGVTTFGDTVAVTDASGHRIELWTVTPAAVVPVPTDPTPVPTEPTTPAPTDPVTTAPAPVEPAPAETTPAAAPAAVDATPVAATPVAAAPRDGALAFTGTDSAPIAGGAAALVGLGLVLTAVAAVRRRRTRGQQ